MKNIIILVLLLIFNTSCEDEYIDFNPVDNNPIALDTLRNYNDYILGNFGGEFLVSTNVTTKGYSASHYPSMKNSSFIQYQLSYKLLSQNIEKQTFVSFRLLESKSKLDATNIYRYKYFSDFIDFFDRSTFDYYQGDEPVENEHNVWFLYQNYFHIGNDDIDRYDSSRYNQEYSPDDFIFIVDSINVIENPIKKVEVYYSFKCIGVNPYDDEIVLENGKGKATFEFN